MIRLFLILILIDVVVFFLLQIVGSLISGQSIGSSIFSAFVLLTSRLLTLQLPVQLILMAGVLFFCEKPAGFIVGVLTFLSFIAGIGVSAYFMNHSTSDFIRGFYDIPNMGYFPQSLAILVSAIIVSVIIITSWFRKYDFAQT